MNAEVKNDNGVAVNMEQNNTNEVPAQTTINNENKENTMKEEQNSNTDSTNNSNTEQTAKNSTATTTAKRSSRKKTEAERMAEKILAKEQRAKEVAAMTDDEKKAELLKIEQHIKRINTGSHQVGFLYKQIRDEKLYEQSDYSNSFSLYCRVTFKESRSNVYRQINYVEILEIIGESFKNYAEKTIRPLTCFKITSKDQQQGKDAPEQYDTAAIQAVWMSVKKTKKTITEKLVKEHVTAYRKTLMGGNDPDKVYVPSMNKCFNRSSFVDELIKEKKTAAGLLSVTKEMKDILTADELGKIKEESDSLTDKEFQTYQKNAHAEDSIDMSIKHQSA